MFQGSQGPPGGIGGMGGVGEKVCNTSSSSVYTVLVSVSVFYWAAEFTMEQDVSPA